MGKPLLAENVKVVLYTPTKPLRSLSSPVSNDPQVTIRKLVEKHLDIELFFSKQENFNIAEIKGEASIGIIESSPFSSWTTENRLVGSSQMFLRIRTWLRISEIGERKRLCLMPLGILEISDASGVRRWVNVNKSWLLLTMGPQKKSLSIRQSRPGPSSSPLTHINQASSSSSSSRGNVDLSPEGCRINEVAAFLKGCNPPMCHLLNSFIKFGCRNRKFLEAVADYDDNEMLDFLRTVIKHENQGLGFEMDVWVLKRQFKRYFVWSIVLFYVADVFVFVFWIFIVFVTWRQRLRRGLQWLQSDHVYIPALILQRWCTVAVLFNTSPTRHHERDGGESHFTSIKLRIVRFMWQYIELPSEIRAWQTDGIDPGRNVTVNLR